MYIIIMLPFWKAANRSLSSPFDNSFALAISYKIHSSSFVAVAWTNHFIKSLVDTILQFKKNIVDVYCSCWVIIVNVMICLSCYSRADKIVHILNIGGKYGCNDLHSCCYCCMLISCGNSEALSLDFVNSNKVIQCTIYKEKLNSCKSSQ